MRIFLFMVISFVAANVFAHGAAVPDDVRSGPNGGFVKRAGGFTIETVSNKDGTLAIYLLDASLKNPMSQSSSIDLVHEQGKAKDFFSCETKDNHFYCQPIDKLSLNKGTLTINAKRSGALGRVSYELPFKLTEQNAHHGH